MPITALYAGLLAPLFVFLAFRVIALRRKHQVGIGDGGHSDLLRAMRVHANFAEYVPITLLLLALAESLQTSSWLLHLTGIAFVIARVVHAYGVSQPRENLLLRSSSMITTFAVIALLSVLCLHGGLQSLTA